MVADGERGRERERERELRRIVLSGRYTKQIHVIRSRSAAERKGRRGDEEQRRRFAGRKEGRKEMEGNIGSFYLSKLEMEERADSTVTMWGVRSWKRFS